MEDLDNSDRSPRRRSLDLSVAQVAASSLAAVAGAVLASELGVYGTILGAAVVSAGATVGGALFQHAFRRTGEQLRELTGSSAAVDPERSPADRQQPDGAAVPFDPFDPGGEHTRMLAAISPPEAESVTVYRGRGGWKPRRWQSWALMSVLVFGLAMGTVTAVELVAGKPVTAIVRDEPGSGTSFGGTAGRSGNGAPAKEKEAPPSGDTSAPGGSPADRTPGPTPSGSPSGEPTGDHDGVPSGGPSAGPGTEPSATPSTTPSSAPTPSGAAAADGASTAP